MRFSFVQEANLDAGESGNHDKVYQLTKHEFSSPGRGNSSGVHALTLNLTSYSAPFFVLL